MIALQKENYMTNIKSRKFVPLTNDLLFKDTYSKNENIKYLEDLLECYYGYPKGYLKDKLKVCHEVTLNKTRLKDKNVRCDLVVTIQDKLKLDIEMYSKFNEIAKKKSNYYVMRIYSTQLDIGNNYNKIGKVTQINFIDNVKVDIKEEVQNTIYLTDDIRQDFVRLDLARKIDYTNSRFIKYLRFIGAKSKEERSSYAKGDEILMELDKWLEWYTNTDTLDNAFNDDYWNKQIYHEDGRLDGIEENSIAIAKNLLNMKMSIKDIKTATGLPIDKIQKLKEEINTQK